MSYHLHTTCPNGHPGTYVVDLWRPGRRVSRGLTQHGVIVGSLGQEDGRVLVRWLPPPKEAEWASVGTLHVEPEELYCTECGALIDREV